MTEKEAIEEIEHARSFGTSGILPRWLAIDTVLKALKEKDKIIDKAIAIISDNTVPQEKCKQCIREYLENEVKESK